MVLENPETSIFTSSMVMIIYTTHIGVKTVTIGCRSWANIQLIVLVYSPVQSICYLYVPKMPDPFFLMNVIDEVQWVFLDISHRRHGSKRKNCGNRWSSRSQSVTEPRHGHVRFSCFLCLTATHENFSSTVTSDGEVAPLRHSRQNGSTRFIS